MTTSELQGRIEQLESENADLRRKLEYAETVAGIRRGLDDLKRGRYKPLRQVDQELRAKHNIAR